jgi:iron complex transport system substrate-binding protein
MKRVSFYFSVVILVSLVLAACAPETVSTLQAPGEPSQTAAILDTDTSMPTSIPTVITPTPLVLIDGLGRQVLVDKPANRIISMAPSNTELLFSVGAGAQVVGRDEFSDYPAEAKVLPSVGGSMGKYNLEQIASLQPDLVLGSALNTAEQVKALEDLNLKVYVVPNPSDLEGLYINLETLGKLTGREEESATLVKSLIRRVNAVQVTLSGTTTRPKVFYELDGSDATKPWTSGPGTFVDMLITQAGGANVAAGLSSSWAQISQEELLAQNPEIILLGDAAYGTTPEQVAQRAGWGEIAAVKGNHILTFDDNLVSRPGPRLVDGLEILAKLIHPELFQ